MKNQGFTLIEVMIVVVIVAILAAVALPSYRTSVLESRRADGMAALTGLQLAMEKYRGSCSQFPTAMGNAFSCTTGNFTVEYDNGSAEGYYTVAINSGNGNSYEIQATPTIQGGQNDDTTCNAMKITVNNANPKGSRTPAECW